MEESVAKLSRLCDESMDQYAEQANKVESRTIAKLKSIQDDLQMTVKAMIDDLEYSKKISMDQVS
eukprot:8589138-Karenia_brevis.AAC.1